MDIYCNISIKKPKVSDDLEILHGSVRTVPQYFTLSSENINNTFCWSLTFLRKKKPQGHIQIQYFPVFPNNSWRNNRRTHSPGRQTIFSPPKQFF